ncbi:MAG TPA: glycosyltransferase [Gammaproteobacteria bacterium]
MNIAHFIGSLHVGGAENQVALLANGFSGKGYECHVIVMHSAAGYDKDLTPAVNLYNLDYRTRYAPLGLYRLYKYLKTNRIEILHCHMYHAIVKAAIIARIAGVRVVVTSEHGKNPWKKWYHHLAEKYLVNPFVNKRVAVSEDIRQIRIHNDGVKPSNIIVMPNSVNTNVKLSDNAHEIVNIGTLGRLVDAKDFPVLIKAVKILVEEKYKISLTIAGEGDQRSVLEGLIDRTGMGDYIKLPGIQPATEFLESIDMFVMSSKREGVPVSLLEAMAHGLPIVTTNVGGIPEVVSDGKEALLCEPGDPALLARVMRRIIDNKSLRIELGNAARTKVVEHYSESSVAEQWEGLYRDLLVGNG